MSVILINTKYAIQLGRELAILKIQLDGAQGRYDICQNQWQDVKFSCDDLRKRKAHIRVFGKISEMHERGYAGIWDLRALILGDQITICMPVTLLLTNLWTPHIRTPKKRRGERGGKEKVKGTTCCTTCCTGDRVE
jgi:hypothetical protein